MFKDRNEELKRLEEELLEEEELPEIFEDAEEGTEEPEIVPAKPRHYRVKSTDRVDVDLLRYSEEIEQAERSSGRGLVLLMVLLALGVAAVLLYYVLRFGGFLS